jgi:hypothetical protein
MLTKTRSLNYLDRNALPQARLNTLEEDLNLKGVEYNTAISILFVGYLIMQGMIAFTSCCYPRLRIQCRPTCFLHAPGHQSTCQSA